MVNKDFNITNHVKQYSDGVEIFSEGTKGRDMFVVMKGEVEISQMINNEPHVLSYLKAGEFFGEMSTIRGVPRIATAKARGDVECLRISPDAFKSMIQQKPGFGVKVIKVLCDRIEAGNKKLEKLTLLNQTEKVIVVLVNLATEHGKKPFKPMKILYENVTTEIANKTKMDQETVGKVIVTLARFGKLQVEEVNNERFVNLSDKLFG